MLVGAWGAHAGDLLERAAEHRGTEVHQTGRLTMLSPPDLVDGGGCCWLFGEPEDPVAFAGSLTGLGGRAYEPLTGRFVVVACERERDRCLVTRDQLGAQPLVY